MNIPCQNFVVPLGLKKKCLIGVTRPTLFTLALPTLYIFINFSTKKCKKIKLFVSLSFPVTHVCASGYHHWCLPTALFSIIFKHPTRN